MAAISYPRTLWVVRHAEREDNINRSWKKQPEAEDLAIDNSHLSKRGRQQAEECATRFKKIHLNHIFASPYDRTVETASIIANGNGVPVKPEAGICEALYLCERPPGFWEPEDLKKKFPLVDLEYVPVFSKYTLPREGCGDDACVPRIRSSLNRITEKYDGDLLFVGHGASIGAIHEVLMGDFKYVGQATVTKFTQLGPNKFKLDYSSDASHLSDKSNLRPW